MKTLTGALTAAFVLYTVSRRPARPQVAEKKGLTRWSPASPGGGDYGEGGEIKCHTGNWNDHGWPIAS